MAIDTYAKRLSAHRVANPWARILPEADGTIDTFDRAHFLGFYGTPAAATPSLSIAPGDVLAQSGRVNILPQTGRINILGST